MYLNGYLISWTKLPWLIWWVWVYHYNSTGRDQGRILDSMFLTKLMDEVHVSVHQKLDGVVNYNYYTDRKQSLRWPKTFIRVITVTWFPNWQRKWNINNVINSHTLCSSPLTKSRNPLTRRRDMGQIDGKTGENGCTVHSQGYWVVSVTIGVCMRTLLTPVQHTTNPPWSLVNYTARRGRSYQYVKCLELLGNYENMWFGGCLVWTVCARVMGEFSEVLLIGRPPSPVLSQHQGVSSHCYTSFSHQIFNISDANIIKKWNIHVEK